MSSSHNPRAKRSSAALPLQNAQKQSWKANFSDKQLERKRQLDRINQRRTRQQSKQSTALLKDKVDLLMQGDHKTLLERMMAENEAMRAKLNVFQAKFEHVHQISRECLEMNDQWNHADPSSPSNTTSTPSMLGVTLNRKCVDNRANIRRNFSQRPSIFFEIMDSMRHSNDCEPFEMPIDLFIENVMAWKYSKGITDGCEHLAQHFSLPAIAENDVIYSKITTRDYYPTLLNLLHNRTETLIFDQPLDEETQGPPPRSQYKSSRDLDITRRRTAYLAYQVVAPWRDFCRSHAEFIAIFWAQYRHLLLFVFPTAENLSRCPSWYRPGVIRLAQNHPGYIDHIIWPCVRDRLTKTWHEHDTETLIRTLLRGFSVRTTGITREEPLIYAKDNTGLELSTHFENAIADIHNFYEQPDFLAQNPDLSAYARADSRTALAISSTGVDHSSSFSIPRLSFDSDFIHGKGQPYMPPGHPMSMIPFQTDWRGKEKAQGSFSYPEAPEFGTMGAYVPADMHEPHCSMSLPFPDASLTQSANGNPLSWSSADYGTADYGTGQLLTLSPTKANYLDWEEKQLDVQPSDVFGIRGTLSYFNS